MMDFHLVETQLSTARLFMNVSTTVTALSGTLWNSLGKECKINGVDIGDGLLQPESKNFWIAIILNMTLYFIYI